MKYYKSFILFSLFALAFVSCNTDDLERDIDALKDRVTNVEAQVQQLNDEMNIIRVLLDGNKTITDYSINGDTYTLTLSNGETLTLTPGVTGGNYPSIEIGANGNWFIGGSDTGWRAGAENGEDASITPEFKIEANPADGNKKYWYVSYDNGATWKVLENGLAEGTNTGSNPISGATVDGDNFKVTFGNKDYFIPIVKGLECAINVPEGMTDGFWMVAGGGTSSFTVKVNLAEGDLVRVKAPVDWNAKLSAYAAGATEVTVTVTPPATPSECVIVVEVTHGVNMATDQIKAKTSSDSYWAEYQAGFDIKVGDVVINKYDNPDGVLVKEGESISGSGVYFIAEGATAYWSGGVSDLVLIGEKKNSNYSSKVITKGVVSLGIAESEIGMLCKEIALAPDATIGSYWFNLSSKVIARLYLDHCKIEMMADKMFSYFSNATSGISKLLVESCYISVPAPPTTTKVINFLNCNIGSYGEMTIHNNVFYCATPDRTVLFGALLKGANAKFSDKVSVDNNTIINISSNHGTSSGFFKVTAEEGWTMKNNLFWYDTDCVASGGLPMLSSLMAGATAFSETNFANNRIFTAVENTQITWQYFRTAPTGFKDNVMTVEKESPFATLVDTEGKYTLKPEYQGIGAVIE